MKKITRILTLLLSISVMFYFSNCTAEEDEPVTPDKFNAYIPAMPDFSGETGYNGVMATIHFSKEINGFMGEYSMGYAKFGSGRNAGTVQVNNVIITKILDGTTYYYTSFDSDNPSTILEVTFGGDQHSWNVEGGDGIPAITNSITSPYHFSITSPSEGADVDKTNGITVEWAGNLNTADNVMITLKLAGTETALISRQDIIDDGSFKLEASQLGGVSGNVDIEVIRFNYSPVSVEGSNYILLSEIVKKVSVNVQ